MNVADFDYTLPRNLIAQEPADRRDASRLLVLDRETGHTRHRHFHDLLEFLDPGDCLVLNDSKVLPARLFGVKEGTGVKTEFLLLRRLEGDTWETMVHPGRRLKKGTVIHFGRGDRFDAEIIGYGTDGTRIVRFDYDGIFMERLEELGTMPLPPYIERPARESDRNRYQTVYSKIDGSVAAPTAGLHFTKGLLAKAEDQGIRLAYVTLHVGIGTFRPVKADQVEDHHMHLEEYSVSEKTAQIINETKASGGKVVAVGTTSVRTIESAAEAVSDGYRVRAGSSDTDIFIYPGYEFKIVDRLITNFHLPKSTLLMLVSAMAGRENILAAYREAVEGEYRFFSYGDAMLIR